MFHFVWKSCNNIGNCFKGQLPNASTILVLEIIKIEFNTSQANLPKVTKLLVEENFTTFYPYIWRHLIGLYIRGIAKMASHDCTKSCYMKFAYGCSNSIKTLLMFFGLSKTTRFSNCYQRIKF